ncbi:T9SS type A sorting domain-containing protein [Flavobacterium sp. J372]|uniref:T9SS type A sorting domain-containing protein n=1 Tax=Flavobacterium sp. J372 TaxID=2898436 RepID=UPI00215078B3|nr:T9SS type A sorting domain-containing protein [Flavobacterium sp. J372]MCR5862441.1 T9SS type A sorting domain-containing protein [Flavobacterium sp. J372]
MNSTLSIQIATIPDENIAPYVICTPDGAPGIFDLTSRIAELTGQHPWAWVEFFPTEADAMADTNEITNPAAFMATSVLQTVYARVFLDGTPVCYWYKPVILATETCTSNSISGIVRYDSDGGGCSASDVPAQSIPVFNYVGNNIYQTFTDVNGSYSFTGTPDGGNTVLVTQMQQSSAITPVAHQVTLPGIVTDKDFCITVPNPVQDVSVAIYPISQARPGFNATYSLVITNSGTIPLSGTVNLYFPAAKVTFVSSYPSMTVSGNSLSLNYVNLQAFQSRSIYITFLVQPPQVVPAGDILTYAATVTPGMDNNSADNTMVLTQEVVNSYDPNDISVLEGATITEAQADGYLHYTIRFQNIGNADALRVRIESMLDSKLDYNTIQPVSASHAYHFERKNDKLTVRFDDIYLAGSQYDEPNSHGYITYRIKPNATVTIGDSMSANASIYFDFNDPINTNTVTTTVQAAAGTADFSANSFKMYPNPANGMVTLKLAEADKADVTITDVLGKTVLSAKMSSHEQNINITALTSGMYFVKVTAEGQSATKKLIVK